MHKRNALLTIILLSCSTLAAPAHSAPGVAMTENLPAILHFVEQHQSDATDNGVSDSNGVLGSKEDQFTYRLLNGIAGAQHENLKKDPQGKGWYYIGSLRDFPATERAAAQAYAANVWAVLQPALEAAGFTFHADNPWDTYTMTKQSGRGKIQVWLDFTEATDGTHVTLRMSPNV